MEFGNVRPVTIEDEMRSSYLDYAMSVIVARALPDVRDGLKPSQRRVLVAMHDLNLAPNRGHIKCAKIAGDTSGNYHPHGEAIVYPTLVRMAQDFNMRYPLIDGQGNFGSIDNDPPAAMRYTEARLTAIAMEMLADIDKDTVDWQPNYDGRLKAAFHAPVRDLAGVVLHVEEDPDVRVPPVHPSHRSLEGDGLVAVEFGVEGVVRGHCVRRQQGHTQDEK